MQPTTRGTVSSDGAARAVSRPVPVPARRLPARSHPRDRRRTVRHRVGADRGGEDARRRVRHPHGARDGQAHRVHHAAQGALEPEVQRLHSGLRRRHGRHPHGRREGEPAWPCARHDDRDPPERALRLGARRPRLHRPRRVSLHGRRGARHRLGGDHRQRADGRPPRRPVGDRGERQGDRRLDLDRAPADRADLPPAPPRAALVRRRGPRGGDPRDRRGAGRTRPSGRRRAAWAR